MIKVVKFGGSSLASAEQFAKVGKIIHADKERRYVVPSAPGKRNSKDTKVTDMLYACYDLVEKDEDFRVMLMKIKDRYDTIINGLNLKLSLEEEFKKISENFKNKAGVDYAASRGEYLNGIIMANYLGYEFVDAAEVIFFDEDGNYVHIRTKEYVKIPENLKEKIYPVINELNLNFRWCTFVINTDNELIVKMDAILDMDTCGEECKELIYRTVGICDEAYPTIMKALWA